MLGHSIDDAAALAAKAKGLKIDDLLKYLSGSTTMKQTIPMLGQNMNFLTAGQFSKPIGRFAGSAMGRGIARTIPGISAAVNVLDVADVVAGDEGLANKGMDVAAMGIGGTAGAFLGGPLGASIGASLGKTASDGVQAIFGGGKSAEERKMEEALAMLQSRGVV
jgi:hypothetical protein